MKTNCYKTACSNPVPFGGLFLEACYREEERLALRIMTIHKLKHNYIMDKKFELLPPMMPNFVRFKREAGLRQDGFKVDDGFPIANFTKEEAVEYGELMKQTFIKHWEQKQNSK